MHTICLFLILFCASIIVSFPSPKGNHAYYVVRGQSSPASISKRTPLLQRCPLDSHLLVRDEGRATLNGTAASSVPAESNVNGKLPYLPFISPVVGMRNQEISIYAVKEEKLIPESAIKFILHEIQKLLSSHQVHQPMGSPAYLQTPQVLATVVPQSLRLLNGDAASAVLTLYNIINEWGINYSFKYSIQTRFEQQKEVLASGSIQFPDQSNKANLTTLTIPSHNSGPTVINTTTGSSDPNHMCSMTFDIPDTNLAGRMKFNMADPGLDDITMDSCRQRIKKQLSLHKDWLFVEHLEATVGDVTLILDPILTHAAFMGLSHEDAERALRALFDLIHSLMIFFPMEYHFTRHGQDLAHGFIFRKLVEPVPVLPSS